MTLCVLLVLQTGFTPLQNAALNGHKDIVCNLIENGANINSANKVNTTIYILCINTFSVTNKSLFLRIKIKKNGKFILSI